jgi:hypothetical protein
VIALLSMIIPRKEDLNKLPMKEALEDIKQRALAIGDSILNRECIRTVEGLKESFLSNLMTIQETRIHLSALGHSALQSVDLIGSEKVIEQLELVLNQGLTEIQIIAEQRHEAYVKALRQTLGEKRAASMEPPKPKITMDLPKKPPAWLRDQLNKRLLSVESILKTAEFVPVYALKRPADFKNHIASLPSSEYYKKRVNEQLEAQKRWISSSLFN